MPIDTNNSDNCVNNQKHAYWWAHRVCLLQTSCCQDGEGPFILHAPKYQRPKKYLPAKSGQDALFFYHLPHAKLMVCTKDMVHVDPYIHVQSADSRSISLKKTHKYGPGTLPIIFDLTNCCLFSALPPWSSSSPPSFCRCCVWSAAYMVQLCPRLHWHDRSCILGRTLPSLRQPECVCHSHWSPEHGHRHTGQGFHHRHIPWSGYLHRQPRPLRNSVLHWHLMPCSHHTR